MAAPNLLTLTNVTAKSNGGVLTNTSATLIQNVAASNKVFKVNAFYASNKTASAQAVTLTFYDASATATRNIAETIAIPADATLVIVDKNGAIYLEEGDEIRGFAGANTSVDWVASWEELS
jgi:hypothetical protein